LEWIGFVRPTGLVVSAVALARAGAILDRRDAEGQRLLRACVEERAFHPKEGPVPHLPDFRAFAESVLGWSFSPKGYAGTAESPVPPELEVPLPDYGETLRPDYAVRELEPKEGASPWQVLVQVLEPGEDFDRVVRKGGQLEASAHGRMERLAAQVLHALYELLRGFQAAHDASKGELLPQPLAEHPDEVYRALHTVILRLVFLLYTEERDMLPEDETFLRYYSLAGLYERL